MVFFIIRAHRPRLLDTRCRAVVDQSPVLQAVRVGGRWSQGAQLLRPLVSRQEQATALGPAATRRVARHANRLVDVLLCYPKVDGAGCASRVRKPAWLVL